jgi:hypothetical protein
MTPGPDQIYGGLDLTNLETTTARESEQFAEYYVSRFGHEHAGLSFMLRERGDALRAFRLYVRTAYDVPERDEGPFSSIPGFFLYYAHLGYEAGVRYVARTLQRAGFSREDFRDVLGLAALVVGPAGFETIANGVDAGGWHEEPSALRVPAGWDPGLDALKAGLDYSDERLLPGEDRLIEEWYGRWLGEVPPWVPFLARHHPRVLKVQRLRFERCLRVLPKQVLPLSMLHFRLMRGDRATIRENVLMARGFGVTRGQVVRVVSAAIEYGGEEPVAIAAATVDDLLRGWPTG